VSDRSTRFPVIPPEQYTPAQREAAARLVAGPRGEVRGPFVPLLYSPELLDRGQRLGEYLRYGCAVPEDLREFAILVAARHWRQEYEWHAHAPLAVRAGVAQSVVDALALGREPAGISPELEVVYRFCRAVHETGRVDDGLFASARQLLGENGVVDLVGLCGYYAMLAMVLNVARTPVPGDPPSPFVGQEG